MGLEYELIKRRDFLFETGAHDCDAMLVVLGGEFDCTVEGNVFRAKSCDAVILRRGTPFFRRVVLPLECLYIRFDALPWPVASGKLSSPDPARTQGTVELLKAAALNGDDRLVAHFIDDLFILHGLCPNAPGDRVVNELLAYMNAGYGGDITLDTLAGRCGLSKQALTARFRRACGVTPMRALCGIRIRSAKRLLSCTGESVREIAAKCGFENQYYFSTRFRRETGMTPTEYRGRFRV